MAEPLVCCERLNVSIHVTCTKHGCLSQQEAASQLDRSDLEVLVFVASVPVLLDGGGTAALRSGLRSPSSRLWVLLVQRTDSFDDQVFI